MNLKTRQSIKIKASEKKMFCNTVKDSDTESGAATLSIVAFVLLNKEILLI